MVDFPSVPRTHVEFIVERALLDWPDTRAYTVIELKPKHIEDPLPKVTVIITAEERRAMLALTQGPVRIVNDVCLQIMRHGVAVLEDR